MSPAFAAPGVLWPTKGVPPELLDDPEPASGTLTEPPELELLELLELEKLDPELVPTDPELEVEVEVEVEVEPDTGVPELEAAVAEPLELPELDPPKAWSPGWLDPQAARAPRAATPAKIERREPARMETPVMPDLRARPVVRAVAIGDDVC